MWPAHYKVRVVKNWVVCIQYTVKKQVVRVQNKHTILVTKFASRTLYAADPRVYFGLNPSGASEAGSPHLEPQQYFAQVLMMCEAFFQTTLIKNK